jgi:hypothetical protein
LKTLILFVTLVLLAAMIAAGCGGGEQTSATPTATATPTESLAPGPGATSTPGVSPPPTSTAASETPAPTQEAPTSTPAVGEASILSHSSYIQHGRWRQVFGSTTYEGDFYHVVGEIENTGETCLEDFDIDATFFDSSGQAVQHDGPVHLDQSPGLLAPGELGPFILVLLDEEASAKVESCELSLEFTATAEEPLHVDVIADRGYLYDGSYRVMGEVQNTDDVDVESAKIFATFYDAAGTVIAVDFTYVNINGPNVLAPGQKSPFEVYPNPEPATAEGRIAGHSLHIECRESTRVVYEGIEIASQQASIKTYEGYVVEGQLTNAGDKDAEFVKVIGTFYAADGSLLAFGSSFADPRDLTVGQTGQFVLRTGWFSPWLRCEPGDVADYELRVLCSVD